MWQIGGFLTFGIACVQLTMAEVLGCKEGCCPPGPHSEAGKDSFGNSSANLLPHFDGPNSYETLLFAPRYWILRWSSFLGHEANSPTNWIYLEGHSEVSERFLRVPGSRTGCEDLLQMVNTWSWWEILYDLFRRGWSASQWQCLTCSVTFSCTTGALECGRV